MNLNIFQDGYIHVILRQLPRTEDDPPGQVKIELAVFDTGKVKICVWTGGCILINLSFTPRV